MRNSHTSVSHIQWKNVKIYKSGCKYNNIVIYDLCRVVTEAEAIDLSRMSGPVNSPQRESLDGGMCERDSSSDCVISFVFDWLSSDVIHVGSIVVKMALVLASNAGLWFSLLNVISPVLDMH
jgi:hypothetical protein